MKDEFIQYLRYEVEALRKENRALREDLQACYKQFVELESEKQ